MTIRSVHIDNDKTKVILTGIISLAWFFQTEKEILRAIKLNRFKIELDLSGVKHMDYRGIEILIKRAERLRSYGGDLVISGASAYLIHIFGMAGAEKTFPMTCYESGQQKLL